MKRTNWPAIIIACLIIYISVYLFYENNTLDVTKHYYINDTLPEQLENFKIAHISDYHNVRSNKLQDEIAINIMVNNPDLIVITGDLVDARLTNIENSLSFVKILTNFAPVYYVNGNHESAIDYNLLENNLIEAGVNIINDKKIILDNEKSKLELVGLSDPSFNSNNSLEILRELIRPDAFQILLSHRPELYDIYVENDIEVVFTGHAHGGQVIIPFIGAIFAPHQGFFPQYTENSYTHENTTMYVSRGIGNSSYTFRVNNNPELVLVEFKAK